jgi:hypothetical protein
MSMFRPPSIPKLHEKFTPTAAVSPYSSKASAIQQLITLVAKKNPRILWLKFLASQTGSILSKHPEINKTALSILYYPTLNILRYSPIILLSE